VADQVLGGVHTDADRHGERQEPEPGLQRAVPEHVLQVQRRKQERAEQHGGGGEHHHEAAADGTVGEALDAQQRLPGVQFQRGERGEAGERGRAEAERLRRRPARGLGLRERVHQRAQACGRQQRAAQIEPAPLRPRVVGGEDPRGATGDQEADGNVDEEDGAPVDELGQDAAE
jgi:hypothetical protein